MPARSLFSGSGEESSPLASSLRKLCELEPGQQADCFALLKEKHRGETRDGKPYFRCQFRDLGRTVSSMIWNDSSWFEACQDVWQAGDFSKSVADIRKTSTGLRLKFCKSDL